MVTTTAVSDSSQPGSLNSRLASALSGDRPVPVCLLCQSLHGLLNRSPRLGFPFPEGSVPRNGIYLLFEDGEKGHGADRIVRVGTHTGDNQLRARLEQHFLKENKDRSIFRKNIGRCLLNREHDPFLVSWQIDLTTREARAMHLSTIDSAKQKQVEREVTDYIRSHLRFVVIEIPSKDRRLEIESKITSTISLCDECAPSSTWLGQHSPVPKIRDSGLWQVNELYKVPLSVAELNELFHEF